MILRNQLHRHKLHAQLGHQAVRSQRVLLRQRCGCDGVGLHITRRCYLQDVQHWVLAEQREDVHAEQLQTGSHCVDDIQRNQRQRDFEL